MLTDHDFLPGMKSFHVPEVALVTSISSLSMLISHDFASATNTPSEAVVILISFPLRIAIALLFVWSDYECASIVVITIEVTAYLVIEIPDAVVAHWDEVTNKGASSIHFTAIYP